MGAEHCKLAGWIRQERRAPTRHACMQRATAGSAAPSRRCTCPPARFCLLLRWPQVGVVALAACMLFTLRGRIGMKTVLPASAGGSAAALAGPKHQ